MLFVWIFVDLSRTAKNLLKDCQKLVKCSRYRFAFRAKYTFVPIKFVFRKFIWNLFEDHKLPIPPQYYQIKKAIVMKLAEIYLMNWSFKNMLTTKLKKIDDNIFTFISIISITVSSKYSKLFIISFRKFVSYLE